MNERGNSIWRGVWCGLKQGLREGPYGFLAPMSPGAWRHAGMAYQQGGWRAGLKAFSDAPLLQATGKLRWR